jgi:hypothetical protein
LKFLFLKNIKKKKPRLLVRTPFLSGGLHGCSDRCWFSAQIGNRTSG